MFPSTIHKNILHLDKQISVLETECYNMNADGKKRGTGQTVQPRPTRCNKTSNLNKSPFVRNCVKKTIETSKKTKKLSPASSSRVYSTSSLPSNYSNRCGKVCEPLSAGKISKQCSKISNTHLCPCQSVTKTNNSLGHSKHNGYLKCNCVNECPQHAHKKNENNTHVGCNFIPENKSDCIVHKEVLFSNSGGSIEVTVRQKQNSECEKENEVPVRDTSEFETCTCHLRNIKSTGQKWSEILSLEPSKQKEDNHISNGVNSNSDNLMSLLQVVEKMPGREVFSEMLYNKINEGMKDNFRQPTKLNTKNQTIEKCVSEKENAIQIQTNLKSQGNGNSLAVLQQLINELKRNSSEEVKLKLLNSLNNADKESVTHFKTEKPVNQKLGSSICLTSQNDIFQTIQKLCDNLIQEKDLLSRELACKNDTIAKLKKREEEYLSLISVLKLNLVKAKEGVKSNQSTTKELDCLKQKLIEQIQISKNLKKSHMELKELLDKYALENDRLKTEIRIHKLEAQKHDVLMAGKDAEIRRYKEEIGNFQRQISEHLSSIKTNAQVLDMKKMMEAIIQQSQIIVNDDLDSVTFDGNEKESSKPKGLLHSSPTSTKTSQVNSSWKQISSIRTQENQICANEIDEKDFYQVFGDDFCSETASLKHKLKKHIKGESKEPDGRDSPGFISCLSVNSERNELCLENSNKVVGKKDQVISEKNNESEKQQQKLRTNIDDLLKSMKQKWTDEIYGTSPHNGTIEDFLNGSHISSISG